MARKDRARPGGARSNLYDDITDKIIAELEAGRVPWVQPWGTPEAGPLLGVEPPFTPEPPGVEAEVDPLPDPGLVALEPFGLGIPGLTGALQEGTDPRVPPGVRRKRHRNRVAGGSGRLGSRPIGRIAVLGRAGRMER